MRTTLASPFACLMARRSAWGWSVTPAVPMYSPLTWHGCPSRVWSGAACSRKPVPERWTRFLTTTLLLEKKWQKPLTNSIMAW